MSNLRPLLLDVLRYGDDDEARMARAILTGVRYHLLYSHPRRRFTLPTSPSGFVYYALNEQKIRVKIGHSADPERRMARALRWWRGDRWTLAAFEPGTWRLERQRHHEFRAFALGDEVFLYRGPLVDHVERLRGTSGGDA